MTLLLAARVVFCALLVTVTYLTVTPNPDETNAGMDFTRWLSTMIFHDDVFGDKIAHFMAYGSLGASAALARLKIAGRARWVVVGLTLYGALLEGVQGLGGVRDPDAADALANACGALAGCIGGAALMRLGGAKARA